MGEFLGYVWDVTTGLEVIAFIGIVVARVVRRHNDPRE
jgi:heme exporter protein D